jgi:hypothetical protein
MASGDFVGIEVQGLEELQALLAKLPVEVQDIVTDDVSAYMLNVLKTYPPQRHITRKQAYGRTFESDKQRRFFFAALKDGRIKVQYHRTQHFRNSWQQVGKGRRSFLANEMPYGSFLVNDDGQSNMAKLGGWKTLTAVMKQRFNQILRVANAAAVKAIRKLKLG